MKVAIAGGTGFIGRHLARQLVASGDDVLVLTRRSQSVPEGTAVVWDPEKPASVRALLSGVDAVVNLAGESVGSGRWTAARKAAIRNSRLIATGALVDAVGGEDGPRLLVSASAAGYYGPGEEPVDEASPPGEDFLAGVCTAWEAEARRAEGAGARCVVTRLGLVLARDGGVLGRMMLPVRLGVGGPIGSGKQWLSWIHIDDVVGILDLALRSPAVAGTVNLVAPEPVRQHEFIRAAARRLHRPSLLPLPAVALRLLLGEQATLVVDGRPIRPNAARAAAYAYRYPTLDGALDDLLGARPLA